MISSKANNTIMYIYSYTHSVWEVQLQKNPIKKLNCIQLSQSAFSRLNGATQRPTLVTFRDGLVFQDARNMLHLAKKKKRKKQKKTGKLSFYMHRNEIWTLWVNIKQIPLWIMINVNEDIHVLHNLTCLRAEFGPPGPEHDSKHFLWVLVQEGTVFRTILKFLKMKILSSVLQESTESAVYMHILCPDNV